MDHHSNGHNEDGVYTIFTDSVTAINDIYCYMSAAPWTVSSMLFCPDSFSQWLIHNSERGGDDNLNPSEIQQRSPSWVMDKAFWGGYLRISIAVLT